MGSVCSLWQVCELEKDARARGLEGRIGVKGGRVTKVVSMGEGVRDNEDTASSLNGIEREEREMVWVCRVKRACRS